MRTYLKDEHRSNKLLSKKFVECRHWNVVLVGPPSQHGTRSALFIQSFAYVVLTQREIDGIQARTPLDSSGRRHVDIVHEILEAKRAAWHISTTCCLTAFRYWNLRKHRRHTMASSDT